MKLQLVTFEQAQELKELGFPQPIQHDWFYKEGKLIYPPNDDVLMTVDCFAPTLELVAKWLREVKGIDLWVRCLYSWTPKEGTRKAGYHFEGDWQNETITSYPTYEEALSLGIDKAIKILKGE